MRRPTIHITKSGYILISCILLLIAALVVAVYFYFQYEKSQQAIKDPAAVSRAELTTAVKDLGKIMLLPIGEDPTLMTVLDKDKLPKDQEFFKNAENGDKLLVYTKAKKAILYRPSIKKIVEVGPVETSAIAGEISGATSTDISHEVKIALYNGSTNASLLTTTSTQLLAKYTNISILSKADAASKHLTKTRVIDFSGNNVTLSASLATFLDGEVGEMPVSEAKPVGADILIIIVK